MAKLANQQSVLELLENLNGLDPLKKLFWDELNYDRVNQSVSRKGWNETASKALADDPLVFAGGGENNDFKIIVGRLDSDLVPLGMQRPVVNRLVRDFPYALFVFSNRGRDRWHFVNVKYDEEQRRRQLFRRISISPGDRLRTASERMAMLDLESIGGRVPPLVIQDRHDEAFDVEAVTKKFFSEIANWYFWALNHVIFPKDAPKQDGKDHMSLIRLITRLMFCWFVKEKGLIEPTLFDERALGQVLKNFAPNSSSNRGSVFYKAILQNLFFATLNTETDKRDWAKEEQNFMAHSLYRHRELFQKPNDAIALFKNIPFLNGGLFECLDKDLGEGTECRYLRIDGFSRRPDSQPIVPDFVFFGAEREVDLSKVYGDKRFRKARVRGLVRTFDRYKFTIAENTPVEEEVALDPELSGKVFENLLAAYNCDKMINYDLHWNPVRLIQRFGRIDRIGSEHEKVYGFNFLPETGLDKNLGLKEKLHNRIQEIHETIGEDAKILDQTEELNEEAMYAIYDSKSAQLSLFEDEKEELLDLNEAEEILRQLRSENPAEYERIAQLRDGIRSARDSALKGMFVFCQMGKFQQLFLIDSNGGVISKDVPRVLGAIKCGADEKISRLPGDYNAALMKIKSQFAEDTKHRRAELEHTVSLTHGQRYVLRELGVLFRTAEGEELKAQINILEKAFRSTRLSNAIKREINLCRRNAIAGGNLVRELGRIYLQHNMREAIDRQRLEGDDRPVPQIICSEALV
jgi:hypothetical protein